jgi:hypothetical protein
MLMLQTEKNVASSHGQHVNASTEKKLSLLTASMLMDYVFTSWILISLDKVFGSYRAIS